ncbi:MAG: capsular biosynthesis protein [Acidobacteriota bacterium]|nr:capsular biosynthesis protein [Acidobacteriota bacterium]
MIDEGAGAELLGVLPVGHEVSVGPLWQARRVAVTGAHGFLGWHTRAALLEKSVGTSGIHCGGRFSAASAVAALDGSSRLVHLAGVNRASDEDVQGGNILFAQQVADALRRSEAPPPVVVYSNSIQAGNGTVYGESKARAAEILATATQELGLQFVDLKLPNLFGEHGRPFYNAVTSTFCHLLAEGGEPKVEDDKELTLLHAQNAADLLIGNTNPEDQAAFEVQETVSELLGRLKEMSRVYAAGEIPDIATAFDRDLFNTYRSYVFESQTPIRLTRHADARGSFFEIIRSHGGPGQSSFSTTVPGVTRGDHFHRRKIERFTVLAGRGSIRLRRLFTDKVFEFEVRGDEPVAVDMPTLWTHNITNTGNDVLYTSFWTNDIFNPDDPDTIAERV